MVTKKWLIGLLLGIVAIVVPLTVYAAALGDTSVTVNAFDVATGDTLTVSLQTKGNDGFAGDKVVAGKATYTTAAGVKTSVAIICSDFAGADDIILDDTAGCALPEVTIHLGASPVFVGTGSNLPPNVFLAGTDKLNLSVGVK